MTTEHYYSDFAVVTPGAIPLDHQPHFAYPTNEAQRRALQAEDIMAEREAVLARTDQLRHGQ